MLYFLLNLLNIFNYNNINADIIIDYSNNMLLLKLAVVYINFLV